MSLENYVNSNKNKDDQPEKSSSHQFPFTLEDAAKVRELVKKYAKEEETARQKASLEASKKELKDWIADTFRESEGKNVSEECLERAVDEYINERKNQIGAPEQTYELPKVQEDETHLKKMALNSAELIASPFFMFTYWRRYSENTYYSIGNWFAGLGGGVMQIEALFLLTKARPLFMAYLATNAISFIYEMARPKRKKKKNE